MKNVIIIGGGCSGLTAAIYLKRANFNVKVFCNYSHGNLTTTEMVENFPGFPSGISGFELLENMAEQCRNLGVEIIDNEITDVISYFNYVVDDCQQEHKYDILVIATGLKHRTLNFHKDRQYNNIHVCATCDGSFYKDKEVAVVGGGNTALQDALYLSNICKKVYLIHRREQFRAQKCIVDRVKKQNNIQLILNSVVDSVFATDNKSNQFNNLLVQNVNNKDIESNIHADALFIAIGFDANLNVMKHYQGVCQYSNNKILINDNKENIYVCGDLNTKYHQAIIACGDGAKVAMQIIQQHQC